MSEFLEQIDSPDDLKKLSAEHLKVLADEIREFILSSVSRTGGHLIISKDDFISTRSWDGRGTRFDKDGKKVKYVRYEDYTKDENDNWVKIKLHIRKMK